MKSPHRGFPTVPGGRVWLGEHRLVGSVVPDPACPRGFLETGNGWRLHEERNSPRMQSPGKRSKEHSSEEFSSEFGPGQTNVCDGQGNQYHHTVLLYTPPIQNVGSSPHSLQTSTVACSTGAGELTNSTEHINNDTESLSLGVLQV